MRAMTSQDLAQRYLAAQAIAIEAGFLARRFFDHRGRLSVEMKGVQDWVTDADRKVEDAIVAKLKEVFPGDGFLTEEAGGSPDISLWVIDPIDGTTNFVHGLPEWCISIAFLINEVPEIGVVYSPLTDELFAARRGYGAFCNGTRMQIRDCADLNQAVIGLGASYLTDCETHVEWVRRLVNANADYRVLGSAALSLAKVADGRLEGFVDGFMNSRDILAGMVLVTEAGGRTSDFLADNGLVNGNAIFTANSGIRDALADATGFAPLLDDGMGQCWDKTATTRNFPGGLRQKEGKS